MKGTNGRMSLPNSCMNVSLCAEKLLDYNKMNASVCGKMIKASILDISWQPFQTLQIPSLTFSPLMP